MKNVTSAKYTQGINGANVAVKAEINGETLSVPLDPDNTDYAAILEWAEEDGNEIQAAE